MTDHRIVSHEQWLEARRAFLAREKELTRLRDELARERRALPWERVDKRYVFHSSRGSETLADLFAGRSQLIMYHLMFAPEAPLPCKSCSFWADTFNSVVEHLAARDVTILACSRSPLAKLEAFAQRMGWTFKWVSSLGSDFNFDYQVSFTPEALARGEALYNYGPEKIGGSERPGISVFYRDSDGSVYHTYSAYARGLDALNNAYQYLDIAPKGRDEAGLPWPMAWVRFHDLYERSAP